MAGFTKMTKVYLPSFHIAREVTYRGVMIVDFTQGTGTSLQDLAVEAQVEVLTVVPVGEGWVGYKYPITADLGLSWTTDTLICVAR